MKTQSRILKKKNGPVAVLAESTYIGTKRHFWVVLSGFSVHVCHNPKEAKAAWRKINAREWQKKVAP
jgi:hypothetical protein